MANLRLEEPHAGNPLVRVCGGLGWVTTQGYPAELTASLDFHDTNSPKPQERLRGHCKW